MRSARLVASRVGDGARQRLQGRPFLPFWVEMCSFSHACLHGARGAAAPQTQGRGSVKYTPDTARAGLSFLYPEKLKVTTS